MTDEFLSPLEKEVFALVRQALNRNCTGSEYLLNFNLEIDFRADKSKCSSDVIKIKNSIVRHPMSRDMK